MDEMRCEKFNGFFVAVCERKDDDGGVVDGGFMKMGQMS
jgi:hypothetical protein